MERSQIFHDLLLLIANLSQVRSQERILSLFVEAISNFHPDLTVQLLPPGVVSEQPTIEINTVRNAFGSLVFVETPEPLSPDLLPAIRNAAKLVAITLENRQLLHYTEGALIQSERHYKTLIQTAPTVILSLSPQFKILEFNPAAEQLFGQKREAVLGGDYLQRFVEKEERQNLLPIWQTLLDSGLSVIGYENTLKNRKGERQTFLWNFDRLMDAAGGPAGIIAVGQDITDRKRAEEDLRLSEQRFSLAMQGAKDGLWDMDLASGLVYYSPRWKSMIGYREEEIGSQLWEWESRLHPDDLQRCQRAIANYLDNPQPSFEIEFRMRHKRGYYVWILSRGFGIPDEAGKLVRFVGTHVDITDRKEVEAQLQLLVDRHQTIISTTQDGFWVVDEKGRILEVNDAYCRMSGYSREELLALTVSDLEANESPEEVRAHIQAVFSEGGGQFETRHRNKEGGLIDLEVSISYSQIGQGSYLCTFLRDITERRALESQLRQAQKMEAIGTLAGGVAHDFNNILAIILGNVELATLGIGSPIESLNIIQKASLRGKALVNQLLTFSRRSQVPKTCLNPIPVIGEALKFIRSTTPPAIRIEEEMVDEGLMVCVETTQLHQMLTNLCTNAIQAMGDQGGVLTVALRSVLLSQEEAERLDLKPGSFLELVVQDSGPGMTAALQERIFEPFYTTKNKDEGTGLGLSVVHGAVKASLGAIHVESEVGLGARFYLYLPVVESANNQEGAEQSAPSIERGEGRVLFVDDEKDLVKLGGRMLKVLGYESETFSDPQKALSRFLESPGDFDVVITDQMMPNMTGIELAGQILSHRPDMPIFLCSGYSENIHADTIAELGLKKYLQKPLTLEDFSTALKEVAVGGCQEKPIDYKPTDENIEEVVRPAVEQRTAPLPRLLYVDDEEALVNTVALRLKASGYRHALCTADPEEALRRFQAHPEGFDVVITDLHMPSLSGRDLAQRMVAIRPEIPVYLCSAGQEGTPLPTGGGGRYPEVVAKPATFEEIEAILSGLKKVG
ncbi:MAG: PAS domain S-box protein [Magnetococcales bacterium]|nr:PAS domain S-box protein [Magnetococcales bacterium]